MKMNRCCPLQSTKSTSILGFIQLCGTSLSTFITLPISFWWIGTVSMLQTHPQFTQDASRLSSSHQDGHRRHFIFKGLVPQLELPEATLHCRLIYCVCTLRLIEVTCKIHAAFRPNLKSREKSARRVLLSMPQSLFEIHNFSLQRNNIREL